MNWRTRSNLAWLRALPGVKLDEPLASRTSFGIGGPADFFLELARPDAIVVIANDNSYGAILFNMKERFGRAIAHELANPDFAKLGEAYGMRGVRLPGGLSRT